MQWLWDHDIQFARWQHPAMWAERSLLNLAPHVNSCLNFSILFTYKIERFSDSRVVLYDVK